MQRTFGLRGFFAALGFLSVFLLLVKLLLKLGALFSLKVGALLALDFKLLFGAQQLDERLGGAVSLLETGANDSQITAVAVAVAWSHDIKKPLDGVVGAKKCERLTARVQIALLAQGNHFFDVRTNRLGLRHSGLYAIFFDHGRDQVA